MKGPPGQAPLPGAGEEEAVALFNNIFEAYIRANGPVDESKPPNVEELLAWAEANPQLVYNAVGAGPEGQSDRERALASIGGVGLGAALGGAGGPKGGRPAPSGGQGVEVIPTKGFVVKSKDDRGRKVFLNICGSDKIPAPGNWANGKMPKEVEELLDKAAEGDEEASQALRFPLSCGSPRNDIDKEGEACSVLDIIFNIDIVKQAIAYKRLKVFVIELALNWVAQKHNLLLDPKYKLPRRDYFGDSPQPQYVRSEPKNLITEVGDVEEEPTFAFPLGKPKGAKTQQQQQQQQRMPAISPSSSFSAAAPGPGSAASAAGAGGTARGSAAGPKGGDGALAELPDLPSSVTYEGNPVTAVLCRIPLPKGAERALASIGARVLQEALEVDGVAGYAATRVALPFAVNAKAAEAWFERDGGAGGGAGGSSGAGGVVLVARLPYRPYADVAAEAKRATVRGLLNLKDATYLDLID